MKSHFKGLAHISIRSRNLEESIRFYTSQLDFEVGYRTTVDPGGPSNGFFPVQYALLERGDCKLELLQPADVETVKSGVEGIIGHFALEVDDIEAVISALTASGHLPPAARPALFPNLFRGSRAVNITGPSGEIIELFEYKR